MKIKLHCVLDEPVKNYQNKILEAIANLNEDYMISTDNELEIEVDFEFMDLAHAPWDFYVNKAMGLGFNFIKNYTKSLWNKHRYDYDCVVFVIDDRNWHEPTTYGWNLGRFFNNYSVQLVRGNTIVDWLTKTFQMEFAHSLDEFYSLYNFGRTIEKYLNLPAGWDFDNAIVHGELPPYKPFEYRDTIKKLKNVLIRIFRIRRLRAKTWWIIHAYFTAKGWIQLNGVWTKPSPIKNVES